MPEFMPNLNSASGYEAMSNVAVTQIPQTEVGSQIEKLTGVCIALEKQLHELEQRVTPVLSLRSENAQGSTSTPEPVLVPLAQQLHERFKHLAMLSDRLQSITSHIEL